MVQVNLEFPQTTPDITGMEEFSAFHYIRSYSNLTFVKIMKGMEFRERIHKTYKGKEEVGEHFS